MDRGGDSQHQAVADDAAKHGVYCWVTLGKLPAINPKKPENEKLLRAAIEMYRDHPALGCWKGFDEPAWVKQPPEPLAAAHKVFKELDPNHPVVIIQAPTKASLPLEGYRDAGDIFGVDIYPVTYPPGKHSDFGNPELSVVADCTKWIGDASKGKGLWMTLQIAWAGTATPGKTLRFPSFPQQRYMAYAAIINGGAGPQLAGRRAAAFAQRARHEARLELDVLGLRHAPPLRGVEREQPAASSADYADSRSMRRSPAPTTWSGACARAVPNSSSSPPRAKAKRRKFKSQECRR